MLGPSGFASTSDESTRANPYRKTDKMQSPSPGPASSPSLQHKTTTLKFPIRNLAESPAPLKLKPGSYPLVLRARHCRGWDLLSHRWRPSCRSRERTPSLPIRPCCFILAVLWTWLWARGTPQSHHSRSNNSTAGGFVLVTTEVFSKVQNLRGRDEFSSRFVPDTGLRIFIASGGTNPPYPEC